MFEALNLSVVVEEECAVGEEGPVVVLVELCVPDDHSHLTTPKPPKIVCVEHGLPLLVTIKAHKLIVITQVLSSVALGRISIIPILNDIHYFGCNPLLLSNIQHREKARLVRKGRV